MKRSKVNQLLRKITKDEDDDGSRLQLLQSTEQLGVDSVSRVRNHRSNAGNGQLVGVRGSGSDTGRSGNSRRPSYRPAPKWKAQRLSKKEVRTLAEIAKLFTKKGGRK